MIDQQEFQELDFQIAYGQTASLDLGQLKGRAFLAVNNPGSYWIHFLDGIGTPWEWVWPTTFGWVMPLPSTHPARLRVTTSDVPAGYTGDTSNQIADATISVLSDFPRLSLGLQQLVTTKANLNSDTLTLTGPATGSQPVLLINPGSGYVGFLIEAQSGGTTRFSVDNAGLTQVTTVEFDPPATAHQIQLFSTAGVDGRRLNIASGDAPAAGATGSAELQLVPANTAPVASMRSQIQLVGVQGANLERLAITAISSSYIIDTTASGTGTVRNIAFQAEGNAGSAGNQNALIVQSDASVQLRGDFKTDGNGVNFGANRTTICDFGDTGTSYLLFDTRTTTPANNAADVTGFRLRRGGAEKWVVGLNIDGANNDNFNIVAVGAAGNQDITVQPSGTGLFNFAYATVANGGGAAATLGTIGGNGPGAAAQNSWLHVKVNGVSSFIPIWR